MERLTKRNEFDGTVDFVKPHYEPLSPVDCVAEVLNRLAAYEDTGLSPEICAEYKKFEDEAISKGVTFNRIVELMDAESEGRLVVLPEPPKEERG